MTQEANTVILQILLLAAAVGALVYFVRSGQSVGVRASKRIAFGAFIVLNIYAVLRPDDLTYLARAVGIGRGTDLLVYLLVVAFVFGMLNTYLRDREISQHLTNLARQIAVRDAELTRREKDLEQRLTALEGHAATGNGHRTPVGEPVSENLDAPTRTSGG
ncbi:DUF2304 domain-containing protein [Pseudonocardia sp. McavD-2-B]|jgi:hypothetical protein|uniref:DUF2304 domain-containing protein n=1 Tax=Pseudonocardia sp. McavD-2-B TaxID=2954499 RepID=UPI0015CB5FD5|nr:DUF2304 domain-containing protein [Pseudonocardia sp. McavD-2-B]MCO7194553.1 DUF2304 domain-containing protein [Pseudonocardia sp. McavD-2-B]